MEIDESQKLQTKLSLISSSSIEETKIPFLSLPKKKISFPYSEWIQTMLNTFSCFSRFEAPYYEGDYIMDLVLTFSFSDFYNDPIEIRIPLQTLDINQSSTPNFSLPLQKSSSSIAFIGDQKMVEKEIEKMKSKFLTIFSHLLVKPLSQAPFQFSLPMEKNIHFSSSLMDILCSETNLSNQPTIVVYRNENVTQEPEIWIQGIDLTFLFSMKIIF